MTNKSITAEYPLQASVSICDNDQVILEHAIVVGKYRTKNTGKWSYTVKTRLGNKYIIEGQFLKPYELEPAYLRMVNNLVQI